MREAGRDCERSVIVPLKVAMSKCYSPVFFLLFWDLAHKQIRYYYPKGKEVVYTPLEGHKMSPHLHYDVTEVLSFYTNIL